jgi:hypothetical protein
MQNGRVLEALKRAAKDRSNEVSSSVFCILNCRISRTLIVYSITYVKWTTSKASPTEHYMEFAKRRAWNGIQKITVFSGKRGAVISGCSKVMRRMCADQLQGVVGDTISKIKVYLI